MTLKDKDNHKENWLTNNPRVVVVGYRKSQELKRLLEKLYRSSKIYSTMNITISLDGGASADVKRAALDFQNAIGDERCEILEREINLGLRKHIIECGELTKKYGAIVLFEDDILPDLYFFSFAVNAISFFSGDSRISQIALYSPRFNETARLPFAPSASMGCPNYFMQLPCSWGQVWTIDQWNDFKAWYDLNENISFSGQHELPQNIAKWSIKSWKKFYTLYLILNGKFVVYPYRSYATNCGDPGGEHSGLGNHYLNTEINDASPTRDDLSFISYDISKEKYDAYMEQHPASIVEKFRSEYKDVSIDLYGQKPISLLKKTRYVITSKHTTAPIQVYPLSFKPLSKNLEYGCDYNSAEGVIVLTAVEDIDQSFLASINYARLAQSLSYYPMCTRINIASLLMLKASQVVRNLIRITKRIKK